MTTMGRFLSVALLLTLLAACAPPTPSPTPTPTTTPSPSPTVTLTPSLTPTATPTPTPTITPTPTPVPSPTQPTSPIRTPLPGAGSIDSDALHDELSAEPPPRPFDFTVVNPEPPRRVPNATRAFWIQDGASGERREILARLRVQTDHVAIWVEEGVWHDVQKLEAEAHFFETQIYSATRAAFGSEWTPGVDNDPRVHVLHAAGLGEGVLGYTSGVDEFPRTEYPRSNQAEMITVNMELVEVGSPTYRALLARQFQRLIQWFQDRNEERWVKEGLTELAVRLNGLDPGNPQRPYLRRPDTSLTSWSLGDREEAAAGRGAAYLFATYFHERFGDEGTRALTGRQLNGRAGFEAALTALEAELTFEELFAAWLAANYLDGQAGADHGYDTLTVEPPALAAMYEKYPVRIGASVRQFGADYILLRGEQDLQVQFTGATATPLLPSVSPHSGRIFWWSNRADASRTTLTRAFDLSAVEEAKLTYWTWYELEPGYDYATLEISTDGGDRWQVLETPGGTDADPHGNNPGWAYTGQSEGWKREEIDLSPYSGGQVLVRFACLTDEAFTGDGLLLDDVAIPQIDYADDFEYIEIEREAEAEEAGWEAAGFVRSDNLVPQRTLALLIGLGEESPTVERLPVEEDQTARWTVPLGSEGWREAVLVLSGLAPLTRQPALYELVIEE